MNVPLIGEMKSFESDFFPLISGFLTIMWKTFIFVLMPTLILILTNWLLNKLFSGFGKAKSWVDGKQEMLVKNVDAPKRFLGFTFGDFESSRNLGHTGDSISTHRIDKIDRTGIQVFKSLEEFRRNRYINSRMSKGIYKPSNQDILDRKEINRIG